jgi:hypothetical protein
MCDCLQSRAPAGLTPMRLLPKVAGALLATRTTLRASAGKPRIRAAYHCHPSTTFASNAHLCDTLSILRHSSQRLCSLSWR